MEVRMVLLMSKMTYNSDNEILFYLFYIFSGNNSNKASVMKLLLKKSGTFYAGIERVQLEHLFYLLMLSLVSLILKCLSVSSFMQ